MLNSKKIFDFTTLDKFASQNRVKILYAFKPYLGANFHDCFCVVATVDVQGTLVEAPIRTSSGAIKEWRTVDSLERLCGRFGVEGIYVAVLRDTCRGAKVRYLNAGDIEHLERRTAVSEGNIEPEMFL